MKQDELGNNLIHLIETSGGSEIVSSISELGLDKILNEGRIKDIPILSTIVSLYKFGLGVKVYLFIKKLYRFLFNIQDISEKERKDFAKRLDADKNLRRKVGKHLLLILDKLDDIEKSDLIARAFKGFIRGEYDLATFQRLSMAVERCLLADFMWIKNKDTFKKLEPHIAMPLTSVGIIELTAIPSVRDENTQNVYKLTSSGKLFLGVIIEGKSRYDIDD